MLNTKEVATVNDVQRVHETMLQFRKPNGHLVDVFVQETMGAFVVGGIVDDTFYKSSMFKQVCFSLKELGELIERMGKSKNFLTKHKKTTKVRTF